MIYKLIKCPLCNMVSHCERNVKMFLSEDKNVLTCPICKISNDEENDLGFTVTKCGHIFCNHCVKKMIYSKKIYNAYEVERHIIQSQASYRQNFMSELHYHIICLLYGSDINYLSTFIRNNNIVMVPITDFYYYANSKMNNEVSITDIYDLPSFTAYDVNNRIKITGIAGVHYIGIG